MTRLHHNFPSRHLVVHKGFFRETASQTSSSPGNEDTDEDEGHGTSSGSDGDSADSDDEGAFEEDSSGAEDDESDGEGDSDSGDLDVVDFD